MAAYFNRLAARDLVYFYKMFRRLGDGRALAAFHSVQYAVRWEATRRGIHAKQEAEARAARERWRS